MEKVYWIWLQCALGCGSAVADLIVKQNMDPAQLYHSSEEELLKLSCFTDATVRKPKESENPFLEILRETGSPVSGKYFLELVEDDDACGVE